MMQQQRPSRFAGMISGGEEFEPYPDEPIASLESAPLVGGSPLSPQSSMPYMLDPVTGEPALGAEQIAAGIGRKTPRLSRIDPYRTFGG